MINLLLILKNCFEFIISMNFSKWLRYKKSHLTTGLTLHLEIIGNYGGMSNSRRILFLLNNLLVPL